MSTGGAADVECCLQCKCSRPLGLEVSCVCVCGVGVCNPLTAQELVLRRAACRAEAPLGAFPASSAQRPLALAPRAELRGRLRRSAKGGAFLTLCCPCGRAVGLAGRGRSFGFAVSANKEQSRCFASPLGVSFLATVWSSCRLASRAHERRPHRAGAAFVRRPSGARAACERGAPDPVRRSGARAAPRERRPSGVQAAARLHASECAEATTRGAETVGVARG